METQNSRRILDRSREAGLKKQRLAEDPTLSQDRTSNGRAAYVQQRPATSGLASSRRLSERGGDSERSGSVRGLHPQLQNQQLEILIEYKTALGELTFNSKPIITNLTIIAGENLDAAKAIAAIVSSNILEVPSEQKLPSLYLLDSIVKNIGKDYIKYFGLKLPEVFCKAYRQVDPSVHQGMRHLFGTWKGVFPPQPLQAIEKELGFTAPAVNKLPSGTISRLDPPVSRPANSIHVNPKYLEAQQRLQHSSKSSQHTQREGSDAFGIKSISPPFREKEYDSDISKSFELEITQGDEKFTRNVGGTVSMKRNGFDGKQGTQNYPLNKKRPTNHDLISRNSIPMSDSWKNAEEEDYTWDDMNSRAGDHDHTATNPSRDHWSLDDGEKMSEASGDSLSTEMKDQAVFGSRGSSVWSEEPPLAERIRSFGGVRTTIPGLSESNKVSGDELSTSYTANNGMTSFQSKVAPASIGSSVYMSSKSLTQGLTVSIAPQKQAFLGVASPTAQSLLFPRDSSPPPTVVPVHINTTQQDEPHARSSRFLGSQNIDPRNKFGQDSMSFTFGNNNPLDQKVKSRNIPSSLSAKASQLNRHTSAAQQLEYEPLTSDLSHKVQKPFSRPLASTSLLVKDPADPLPLPSSGQTTSTNSLLAAVNGILNSHSVTLTSQATTLPPFPNVTNANTNMPVSSLLSSLVAKGLISNRPTQTHNHCPEPIASDSSPLVSISISSAKPVSISSSTELSLCNDIGFQFKGNVLRELHPAVINRLFDDFTHKCGVCEGRVKNQEQVERHLEWHALRNRESNPNKASRAWYADSENMFVDQLSLGPPHGGECTTEPMVPADESQCLCILCGEIFQDFYDQRMAQWMFKGTVYANVLPSSDATTRNQIGPADSIVHDKCINH